MRVTLSIDDTVWKEILKFLSERFGKVTGKIREEYISLMLETGLKELKKSEIKGLFEKYKLSEKEAKRLEKIVKEVREYDLLGHLNYYRGKER